MRQYVGERTYRVAKIANADDDLDADGVRVLNFNQAQEKARDQYRQKSVEQAGAPLTVAQVVDQYLAGRKGLSSRDDSYRLRRHVLQHQVAKVLLSELKSADLIGWRSEIEAIGLKPASVTRISNDLKAALNAGILRHSERLPPSFPLTVKNGLKASKSRPPEPRALQILPDSDIRSVLAASSEVDADGGWEGDLHMLLVMLAATGTRFSQVVRITVADVQLAQSRVMVPVSQKGNGEKAISHTARKLGADVIELLKPAITGRKGHEILLRRPRWRQVGPLTWSKIGRDRWLNPSELSRPWQAIRHRARLPPEVVPYAFRHSSIVRSLREGLPVRLVAAQHDTSSAMIEKHYAAYIVDAMDELAGRAIVPLLTASSPGKTQAA